MRFYIITMLSILIGGLLEYHNIKEPSIFWCVGSFFGLILGLMAKNKLL